MQTLTVGLLGFGLSGRYFHAPIIESVEGLRVGAILVRNEEAGSFAAVHYPRAARFETAETLIHESGVDLVVIAVPNHLHRSLAVTALEAGKHVILEKPFTVTSEDARELAELAKARNLVLSVYHNRRWDGDFRTLGKIIDSGMLGDIAEFESHFDRFRPDLRPGAWKEKKGEGTGLLYDLGSHLIDQALTLFGKPRALYADTRIQRERGEEIDSFEVLLFYENLKVTLKAGSLVRIPFPRFTLLGTRGTYTKYGLDPQEAALRSGKIPKQCADWGEENESSYGTIHTTHQGVDIKGTVKTLPGNYCAYYEKVYRAVVMKEPAPVTADQGITVIEMIEKALESARLNKVIC